MLKTSNFIFKIVILFFLSGILSAGEFFDIERRRDQHLKESGYFILPMPYSLPGIGEGMLLIGLINNYDNKETDFMVNAIDGDVGGYGFGVGDWYLIDKRLKFELLHSGFNKASIQSYSTRGMDSNKNDYINVEVGNMEFTGMRATVSFYEKMIEFFSMAYLSSFKLDSLKDKDGNLILDASDSEEEKGKIYIFGATLDYTDDRLDPREGIRAEISLDYSPQNGSGNPDFYVSNYNLTGYLPIGDKNTMALNYYRSDANVIKKGESDFGALEEMMGLDCSILDEKNKKECEEVIFNAITGNKYGTASSLGGSSRLRAYPQGRYSGAHTESFGAEFRWNMTDESTPFDILVMKDIRTSIQTAFFYETGTVCEKSADLWKESRVSYGAGFRMITGSGLVYRFDVANGDENTEISMIVNYPWEQF